MIRDVVGHLYLMVRLSVNLKKKKLFDFGLYFSVIMQTKISCHRILLLFELIKYKHNTVAVVWTSDGMCSMCILKY